MQELRYRKIEKERLQKLKDCNSLDELFCLWRKAHLEEEKPENTFPQCPNSKKSPDIETFKNSFCSDGVTSAKGGECNCKASVEVLFVLKEANVQGTPEKNGKFWFNVDTNDSVREDYCKKFQKILESLGKSTESTFGYMNLNKRGGYGHTTPKKMECYVTKYKEFIKKQIELHAPKIIILCGCYDVVAKNVLGRHKWNGHYDTININSKNTMLCYVYHPSYRNFNKSLDKLPK